MGNSEIMWHGFDSQSTLNWLFKMQPVLQPCPGHVSFNTLKDKDITYNKNTRRWKLYHTQKRKGGHAISLLHMLFVTLLRNSLSARGEVPAGQGGGERGEGTSHLANISRPKLPRGELAFLSGLISTQPFSSRPPTPSIFPRTQCHRRNRV